MHNRPHSCQLQGEIRKDAIKDKHPDELYAICRTDNNYWRHYRASPKLTIDELSMMICRDVGCDLSYCQLLVGKPKSADQVITNCDAQFNAFRNCVIREKKMFKSIVAEKDHKSSEAIVDYLDRHFKEKALLKKQRQMMGNTEEELKEKIAEMEMN